MSKLEQYGHNFQVKVLSTLVKDREFLQQVADIVSPDFFDNEANKWIVSKTLEYFMNLELPLQWRYLRLK